MFIIISIFSVGSANTNDNDGLAGVPPIDPMPTIEVMGEHMSNQQFLYKTQHKNQSQNFV